jgi:rhodanese-related sulfurtransferase
MRFKRIEKFTRSVTKGLLPTQQATISQIVCGILVCRSLILAEIARCFQSHTQFPHNLKRAWRFVSNERIQEQKSKEVVARRLIRQLHHRLQIKAKDYLQIIIDWTSVHPFQVLSALIPVEGRAVPVLQWAIEKTKLKAYQNTFEMLFIKSLRRCLPKKWKVVIVADRGFQRAEFLQFLKQQGLSFVIRVKGDAFIKRGGFEGKLRDYPLAVGQCFKLSKVIYHKTKRYPMKIVLNCARIEGKVSSWLLATDLGLSARQIVEIYRRRFWCEESFRDQKQEFELEAVRVTKACRLENLLVALAIVMLILAVIGMRGNKLGYRDKYCTRKKKRVVLSWVQVALNLLRESAKFLNLLIESRGIGFNFRWA